MRRGEVYTADLSPRSGSEQRGQRPVILVSHDSFNKVEAWRSVIVVPLSTSPRQARRGPSAVFIPAAQSGTEHDSVALCHQVTTLDRSKLTERLGLLPDQTMAAVDSGLRAALALA